MSALRSKGPAVVQRLVAATALVVASASALEAGQGSAASSAAPLTNIAVPSTAAPAGPSRFENLSIFFGLDGSKQPQDLGINAHLGVRASANVGFAVVEKLGLGAQVGAAWNISDAAVHVLDQIGGPSRRTQSYLTLGVFQRTAQKVTWAVGYDMLHQDYYDNFTLSQWRADFGYDVATFTTIGAAVAKAVKGDDGRLGQMPVRLDPITQVTGYFRHLWPTGAQTSLWAGVASGHSNIVWVFPENSRKENAFVYGADLHMPLSDRFAVSGQGNFVTPTGTGTVDAYIGLVFYPGRSAMRLSPSRFAPVIAVANNPTFAVNLKR